MPKPTAGALETRALPIEVDGRKLRGVVPFGVESRDLGGYREVIEPGALDGADLGDLVATVEHAGVPIGRYPGTLDLEERSDGLHWSVELPESRGDVREAVERGDLRAGSWRMRVGRERWEGDRRHIEAIAELRDVAVVAAPAYPAAAVELRSAPDPEEGKTMPELQSTNPTEAVGLPVEQATAGATGSLLDEFRSAGFPGERAVLPFARVMESRGLTVAPSAAALAPVRVAGVPLGADQRFAWPVFPRVDVDEGTTSVDVLRQNVRAIAAPADVIRAIGAVTPKPETSSGLVIASAPLKQVPSVSTGIPNIYLESQAIRSIVESDLRLAVNGGLDKLVLDALATAGHEDPTGAPLLIAIRRAITTVQAAGYAPDTLVLDPVSAEALDTLRATADAAEEVYVFSPGQAAPGTIFGLRTRVAKGAPAPVVADSQAVGRLYVAPVSLARFEENAGRTNTSTVRLETHAHFQVERIDAAVRIAAA